MLGSIGSRGVRQPLGRDRLLRLRRGAWISEAGASGQNGEFGVVNPVAQGGDDPGDLSRSRPAPSRSTGAGRCWSAGSLSFSLSQPLRVENGWAIAHGAGGPHQAGRGPPSVAPGRPRARRAPARPGGAVEPAAPAGGVPVGRDLEPLARPPGRVGAAARAALGVALGLLTRTSGKPRTADWRGGPAFPCPHPVTEYSRTPLTRGVRDRGRSCSLAVCWRAMTIIGPRRAVGVWCVTGMARSGRS